MDHNWKFSSRGERGLARYVMHFLFFMSSKVEMWIVAAVYSLWHKNSLYLYDHSQSACFHIYVIANVYTTGFCDIWSLLWMRKLRLREGNWATLCEAPALKDSRALTETRCVSAPLQNLSGLQHCCLQALLALLFSSHLDFNLLIVLFNKQTCLSEWRLTAK